MSEQGTELQHDFVWGAPLYLVNRHYQHFVNIAVCGAAGAGKSSLVNTLLNRSAGDADAAPVGLSAQTQTPVAYPFNDELFCWPLKEKVLEESQEEESIRWRKPILLWDLPGAATRRWPQEHYCRDLGIAFYDLVIVVFARRVSEVDKLLVKELRDARVPFFLVRSKLDVDVKNNALDHAKLEAETLDLVRQSLHQNGMPATFMTSTRRPAKFELYQLCMNLYGWIQVNVRREAMSDSQCPMCGRHALGLGTKEEKLRTTVVQWTVEVDRSTSVPLGVDLDSDSLEIVAVLEEGLIPQWNAEHVGQQNAVQAGDRIRMVNGYSDAYDLINECRDTKELEITMAREMLERKDDEDWSELGLYKDQGGGGAGDLLLQAGAEELRPRKCQNCGLTICGRCASMLAFVVGINGATDSLCPKCNKLMNGGPREIGWLSWLFWWGS